MGCDYGCQLTSATRFGIQIFFGRFIVGLNRSPFFSYRKCQRTHQKDDNAHLKNRTLWLETVSSAQVLRLLFHFDFSRIFIYAGLRDVQERTSKVEPVPS
jgi:hypothetical protein